MRSFENNSTTWIECILINDKLVCDNMPDMKGVHVNAYIDLLWTVDILLSIDHCIAKHAVWASHLPNILNPSWRRDICDMTKAQLSKLLIAAKSFQRKTVNSWNPDPNLDLVNEIKLTMPKAVITPPSDAC
jgi:hypothetical protein